MHAPGCECMPSAINAHLMQAHGCECRIAAVNAGLLLPLLLPLVLLPPGLNILITTPVDKLTFYDLVLGHYLYV